MTKLLSMLAVVFAGVFIAGCASTKTYTIQIHKAIKEPRSIKQVVLFLDGTQNDRDSRTNIATLSEIVKHQDRDNLFMFYNEGVGTDGKFIGAGTGLGIDKDIVEAYTFLSEYYSPESSLYIFGFSRGAYTSRILAGMIYSVGVYNLNSFKKEDRPQIARELYYAYKGKNGSIEDIKGRADKIISSWKEKKLKGKPEKTVNLYENVQIEIMGLWDTVEALGVIPTVEAAKRKLFGIKDPQNIVDPNGRYIDQICNVNKIYQALALDDNRAHVFTPIIISSDYVTGDCKGTAKASIGKIDEVWFSGAHADIGGGYTINEGNKKGDYTDRDVSISGVSLNWMIKKIKQDAPNLLPEKASVFGNPLGYVHNAENGDFKYELASRNIIISKHYKEKSRYGRLRIHSSVLDRISKTTKEKEKMGFDSGWYAIDAFKECFKDQGNGAYEFKKCKSIEVVH